MLKEEEPVCTAQAPLEQGTPLITSKLGREDPLKTSPDPAKTAIKLSVLSKKKGGSVQGQVGTSMPPHDLALDSYLTHTPVSRNELPVERKRFNELQKMRKGMIIGRGGTSCSCSS